MSKQSTKQQIVDIARQIFARRGFENTTMNDISQISGKSRRTIYTYFSSKEEIYTAVIEGELAHITLELQRVAQRDMSPEDLLVDIIFAHLDLIKQAVQRNGNLRAEFFQNILLVSRSRKNFDRSEKAIIAEILTQGVQSGLFQIDDIPLMADIIHYSVRGLEIPHIYGRLNPQKDNPPRRETVRRLIHKALFPINDLFPTNE